MAYLEHKEIFLCVIEMWWHCLPIMQCPLVANWKADSSIWDALGIVLYFYKIFLKNALIHFRDFPTFTNSTNLQIIALIFVFPVLFHPLLKALECRCCTQGEKVLSSLRLEIMAQGSALQCSERSVIPLSYPGTHTLCKIMIKKYAKYINFGTNN